MRKRTEAFAHPTFDGALKTECMSSEESGEEFTEAAHPSGAHTKVQVLRRRGLPWRSSRLMRFYSILDEGLVAHVGFNETDSGEDWPVVIPMIYGRSGDELYLHGHLNSRTFLS